MGRCSLRSNMLMREHFWLSIKSVPVAVLYRSGFKYLGGFAGGRAYLTTEESLELETLKEGTTQ